MAWINSHYSGKNQLGKAKEWIEWNQSLGINLLRVFGETEDWYDHGMFGSPPNNKKVWNLDELRAGHRPKSLTVKNEKMVTELFRLSHQTGMAFEYVIDATLKHTPGVDAGVIGHCIRQTMSKFRTLQSEYPGALILVNFHNEWGAHNKAGLTLQELNSQAMRARRWKKGSETAVQFTKPGEGWEPEQWPEGAIMVDHGGRDDFEYRCGTGPYDFAMAAIHPERVPEDREWWQMPNTLPWLRSHGRPVYFSESKLNVDDRDAARAMAWYGNRRSWSDDLEHYIDFMETAKDNGIHFCIHDEKGMQTDAGWPRLTTRLEEYLGGNPPPPPPPPEGVDFRREIDAAYQLVLGRDADPSGYKTYNKALNDGGTWYHLVDNLMRSEERKNKKFNGDPPPPPPPPPPPQDEVSWSEVEDTEFGMRPYLTTPFEEAVGQAQRDILWDGYRNVVKALDCDAVWPYNEISRAEAKAIANDNFQLLEEMKRDWVSVELGNKVNIVTGPWSKEKMSLSEFKSYWLLFVLPAWNLAARLNGCAALAKTLCG
jgi:hypothetical protein